MTGLRAGTIVVSIAMIAIMGGCKGKKSDAIRIGQFAALTGSTATFGEATSRGVEMAVEEANAQGGIDGRKIELLTEDTQSKPDVARTVVTKLVSEGVLAVIGEVASTRTMAAAPIAQAAKIPLVTPSSTNPEVTRKGDYIFRVCFTDDFQAAVVAHFAYDRGYRKAAIFKDIKNDYSVAFAAVFSAEFQKLGGKIVSEQSYQADNADFKAQLTTIRSAGPDCVLVPGYYGDVGTIGRQARDIGLNVPLLGGDGWDSPKLIEGAGTALEGCFFSDHYFSPDLKEPATQKFIADFQKKYGVKPDALAALGYDAAGIVIAAMKRAKSLTGPAIRDALAQTKDYPGVAGKVTIDADRNARKAALIMQVRGKETKVFRSYTPEQIGK